MSGALLPVVAAWLALGVIAVIGLNLLFDRAKRREDGNREPAVPLAQDADPANLRRRRPSTGRLSGAVLIVAAIVLFIVLRPALGLA